MNLPHTFDCLIYPLASWADVAEIWTDSTDLNGLPNAGEMTTRTYIIINRGTTTLSNFCVTDQKFGASCLDCAVQNNAQLLPNAEFMCEVESEVSYSGVNCKVALLFQGFTSPTIHTPYTFGTTCSAKLLSICVWIES